MDRNEVLRNVDVERVLNQLGVTVKKAGAEWADCLCPFHQDKNPSFRVALRANGDHETGFWICRAENIHGSLFDLIIKLGRAQDFAGACAFLGALPAIPPAKRKKERPNGQRIAEAKDEMLEGYERNLRGSPEALHYLQVTRGLSETTIVGARLGCVTDRGKVCITIPTEYGIKYRPIDRSGWWQSKGSRGGIYWGGMLPEEVQEGGNLFVVESELDALLLQSLGECAVSVGGTSGMTLRVLSPLWDLRWHRLVILADFDEAGRKASDALAGECRRARLPACFPLEPLAGPDGERVKDPGDLWLACAGTSRDSQTATFLECMDRMLSRLEVLVDGRQNSSVWDMLDMRRKENGETVAAKTLRNWLVILQEDPEFQGKLWLNEMGDIPMYEDRRLADEDFFTMAATIEQTYQIQPGIEMIAQAAMVVARSRRVHPAQNWVRSLTWDKSKRLDSVVGGILVPAKDQDVPLKAVYFRKWLIGAVARLEQPGCKMDAMLVLYSERQGVGKSRFAEILGGPWFTSEPIHVDQKDSRLNHHRAWIVEASELDAVTRKDDKAALRAHVSRASDMLRPPYGKLSREYPRSFVYLGTTNDKAVVKEDDGRRFLPIEVVDIDLEMWLANKDQIVAEARAAFLQGESWWLGDEEDRRRRADTEAHFSQTDAAEDFLEDWTRGQAALSAEITLASAFEALAAKGYRVHPKDVATLLRRVGGSPENAKRDGKVRKVWKFAR